MNWLDIILLVILVWSVAISFRRGLTREIVGLVSVVLALLLGIWFYGTAGSFLAPYLSSRYVANFVGFIVVFALVMVAGSAVGFAIGKVLKVTGLSIVDHLLGAAFGALRAILISVALIMAIMAFSPGSAPPGSVVHSRIAPYMTGAARVVSSIAPHELREGFRKTYAEVRAAWDKTVAGTIGRAQF